MKSQISLSFDDLRSAALSVTEITRQIKQTLETGFTSVLIQGELSNFKRHTSGHLYFTLKDEGAQIAGVMWRSRAAMLPFTPQDGMKVVVAGRISVYEVRGVYQVDAVSIRPLGAGELQLAFERLKQKLAAEGMFDADHKKPLPEYPARIGIVTSRTGAALQDMLKVLGRRFPALTVVLNPVRVQGIGAAEEIANAIRQFNDYGEIDVMIVGRGGGSLEDLWAFNEETVARAIYASAIPVVSAVGHEIDFTIADLVADLRAPTPSAAAEMVVKDRLAILDLVRNNWYTLRESMSTMVTDRRASIRHLLESYSFNRPVDLLRQHTQRLDEVGRSLGIAVGHRFELLTARCGSVDGRIRALDPARVLQRGYAIVRKNERIVSSKSRLAARDEIDVEFHDGSVRSIVS